jgi:hypothetical protein
MQPTRGGMPRCRLAGLLRSLTVLTVAPDKKAERQQRQHQRIARSGVVSFDKAFASALRYVWRLTLSGLGATANGGGLLPLFPNRLGPGASRGISFTFA